MPRPVRKPNELLQAQVATYASERLANEEGRTFIFRNIGDIATGGLQDVVEPAGGAERVVAHAGDYIGFMRMVNGSNYDPVQSRYEMLVRYEQDFKKAALRILEEVDGSGSYRTHPDLIGSGEYSDVFKIMHDDKEYALRVPRNKPFIARTVDAHVAGAVLGKGLPHLEQVIAASYSDGCTVAEVMPGTPLDEKMSSETMRFVSDEQLSEFIDTIGSVHEHTIGIDVSGSNLLYDKDAGFGIIDYCSAKRPGGGSYINDKGFLVGLMANVLRNAGRDLDRNPSKTTEYLNNEIRRLSVNLDVIERFKKVARSKLSSRDYETAAAHINLEVGLCQTALRVYSDPDWVAERTAGPEYM